MSRYSNWDHGIDGEKLGMMAQSGNQMAQSKLACEIINELRSMARMFKYKTSDDLLQEYARRLINRNSSLSLVKRACEHFIDTSDTMPSYAVFKGYIEANTPQSNKSSTDIEVKRQQKEYQKLRQEFISQHGEEILSKMGKWYLEKVCQLDQEIIDALRSHDFGYDDYQLCFLMDWRASGFTMDGAKLLQVCRDRYNKCWEDR